MKIPMKIVIFFNLPPTSNHLHSLQVENCDSDSLLVVDEDDNGKFRLERVNITLYALVTPICLTILTLTTRKCF